MSKLFVAALVVFALAGISKHKVAPRIVEQSVVHPTNCLDNDPLMPVCTMLHVVMENPLLKPVNATIQCGADEAEIVLSPRTRLTVDVEMTLFVTDPSCDIIKWKVKQ